MDVKCFPALSRVEVSSQKVVDFMNEVQIHKGKSSFVFVYFSNGFIVVTGHISVAHILGFTKPEVSESESVPPSYVEPQIYISYVKTMCNADTFLIQQAHLTLFDRVRLMHDACVGLERLHQYNVVMSLLTRDIAFKFAVYLVTRYYF